MQGQRPVDTAFLDVLMLLVSRLNPLDRPWAVTGSLGFALQGVPVAVHDIDLQTDREGAYAMGRLLHEFVVRPVAFSSAERIRSHFGVLQVDGIRVEIMGDLQKRLPDGSWEPPVDVGAHRSFIEVEGCRVPVLDLRYEEKAYRQLGRHDKADMLARWLQANGDDN